MEKTNQEKVARVLQQTHERGSVQFVDNRLSNIAQMLSEQPVQRVDMEEDEDLIQGRFSNSVQRIEDEEDETFQMKTTQLLSNEEEENLQMKADSILQKKLNNTGLPDHLKAGVEHLSGFSMDNVRVHYNSDRPATVQALAYTQGTDIHVAPGQEKHLSHEAWHVAQQMAGRVQPTTEIGGMPVNDNVGLEHEADVMGEKANNV